MSFVTRVGGLDYRRRIVSSHDELRLYESPVEHRDDDDDEVRAPRDSCVDEW